MKINQMRKDSRGFTIIELLIATAIFSIVLIIFLSALLRISQIFYKGVNLSNTQEATRNLLQDISDDVQFFNTQPSPSLTPTDYFCIGDHRYAFKKGVQVDSGLPDDYGIVREVMTTCEDLVKKPINITKAEKLLDPGMQLNAISFKVINNGLNNESTAVGINLSVVYYGSDNKVFLSDDPAYVNDINSAGYNAYQAPDARCTGPPNSTQFCATAKYSSTVLQSY
ncbi:MAG TPA: prepilin-type N-terminal cleavage/methylation domain-containing protein [Candidatus Babeliales bacterium]|nr:prepilin-type N-terminal cleavage/methylation domain-containing protein [Candidatus Babeliales bacterium]